MKQGQRDYLPLVILIMAVVVILAIPFVNRPETPEDFKVVPITSNDINIELAPLTSDGKRIPHKLWVTYSGEDDIKVIRGINTAVTKVCALISYDMMIKELRSPRVYIALIKVKANAILLNENAKDNKPVKILDVFVMQE